MIYNLAPMLPGSCSVCGCFHEPDKPHNIASLYFKYEFRERCGHFPTKQDACAHCSDEVKREYLKDEFESGDERKVRKRNRSEKRDKPEELEEQLSGQMKL